MKKRLGEITINELKAQCKNPNNQCDICPYCVMKCICFTNVFSLFIFTDLEIEIEEEKENESK